LRAHNGLAERDLVAQPSRKVKGVCGKRGYTRKTEVMLIRRIESRTRVKMQMR
jgi:hypothetical protein